jgi:hypothetical protein
MLSTNNHVELKFTVERCFATMEDYLNKLKERDKEYLEFKSKSDNSLQFRMGFRNFVVLAEIHPIYKKPHITFKTFEIIDFIADKKLAELKALELTHFDDDNFGTALKPNELQESYFSKLEKTIYSS